MPYNERQLTSDLAKHLKKNPDAIPHSCAVELKYVRGNKLSFKHDLRPHQHPTLFQVANSHLFYKISDASPGAKPFDAFYLKEAPAYLAVCYQPRPRNKKNIYFLHANTLTSLILGNTHLSEDSARRFCSFTIQL